ncbi:U3 small nucleolar RNA-associated protein 25 homolog [Amia ocellicauda]|uniref:U3 small nucleolar RNA-associated protein 25 homolog n=1 Tax=Amia ocellicauda TaxID=2972642 RepID=UPI003464ADD1
MGKKRPINQTISNLTKKQKKHLKEFGEQHPFHDTINEKAEKTQILQLVDSPEPSSEESDVDSDVQSEPEQESAYQKLLSTLSTAAQEVEESEEEEEESEGEIEEAEEGETEDDEEGGKSDSGSEEEEEGGHPEAEEQPRQKQQDLEKDHGIEEGEEKDGDKIETWEEFTDREHESLFSLETNFQASVEKEEERTETAAQNRDSDDPFMQHLNTELTEKEVKSISSGTKTRTQAKWSRLGNLVCSSSLERHSLVTVPRDLNLSLAQLHRPLEATWSQVNQASIPSGGLQALSPLQQELLALMGSYRDVYFPESSPVGEGPEVQRLYCLHVLNHVLKANSQVLSHNGQLREQQHGSSVQDEPRDQGLTRPKVLIMVPFRGGALRVVQTIISLLESGDKKLDVSHKKRFKDEFGADQEDKPSNLHRPDDYHALFSGNVDDHFRIGVAILKKSIRLYAPFYSSDIIIASPLGLRTLLGVEGEAKRDFDFLSSIELLVIDQADVFLMQNWEHMLHVMKHLNLQPLDSHGVDFSRVRMWNLNNWAKYYRQTLIFSAAQDPQINNIHTKHCFNYRGQVSVKNLPKAGSICQVLVQLPHVFQQFSADSFADQDARFQFFVDKVLPQYRDAVMSHTMVYVPSYFDYVRLRNFLRKEEINFTSICEYSKKSEVSRARHFFQKGDRQFLLFTERFHFYKRYNIRGIQNLIFYALPTYPHFYSEVCNMLQASSQGEEASWTCTVLYSRYDMQRLAAVVGASRAAQMLQSKKSVHLFVTGGDEVL